MSAEAPPRWLTAHYPDIADAVMHLAGVLRVAAATPHAEAELRLGHPGTPWCSDCSFDVIDRFLHRCSDGDRPGTLQFDAWSEHVDYFHRDEAGNSLRSRVTFDSDECAVRTATVRKQRTGRAVASVSDTDWDVRVDMCIEQPVPTDTLPDLVVPSHVCIAHRCSALAGSARAVAVGPIWRYDVTMRWDAPTRTLAEARQRGEGTAPVHTIELEYVGGTAAIEALGAVYVACSGILKLLDVIDQPASLTIPCDAPFSA